MNRISALYGKLVKALAYVAGALLFLMMLMITADVFVRNVPVIPGVRGLSWSNEVSEAMLYLITMFAAPWLLRRGQHIRVDILLRAIPQRLAWYCEWACDLIALACCVVMVIYATHMAMASHASGALSIKTLITPEWWLLAPLPFTFALLGIEVMFRMQRLQAAERGPRDDAVSSA
jgi:TRAP-type C4-dicarboxylate transport system permease small subunit